MHLHEERERGMSIATKTYKGEGRKLPGSVRTHVIFVLLFEEIRSEIRTLIPLKSRGHALVRCDLILVWKLSAGRPNFNHPLIRQGVGGSRSPWEIESTQFANRSYNWDHITVCLLFPLSTDLFLSHDWGKNNENHKKVKKINEKLTKKGFLTWLDENKLSGDITDEIIAGINLTRCVVIFVTKE